MIIFCDLDGVLADFINGYSRKFGANFLDLPDKEAWGNIDKHPELWNELDPFPGAIKFFHKIQNWAGKVYILTSLPHSSFVSSAYYKREWVKTHLGPDVYMIPCIGGYNKCAYMNAPNDILIDDMLEKNGLPWINSGGKFVHHVEGSDFAKTENNLLEVIYGS